MPYKNKEDQAKAAKRHYENNKDVVKKRARDFTVKAVKRNRKYKEDFLLKHPCIECGFDDIRALDFDHINPQEKYKSVTTLVMNGASISTIKKEMDKCEIRCANCHRIKTCETIWKDQRKHF